MFCWPGLDYFLTVSNANRKVAPPQHLVARIFGVVDVAVAGVFLGKESGMSIASGITLAKRFRTATFRDNLSDSKEQRLPAILFRFPFSAAAVQSDAEMRDLREPLRSRPIGKEPSGKALLQGSTSRPKAHRQPKTEASQREGNDPTSQAAGHAGTWRRSSPACGCRGIPHR